MEEVSIGELTFQDTSLKRNNGKIYVLVYRKLRDTDKFLQYNSHHQTNCCTESLVSSLFNRAHSFITNKDDLNKEKAKIKQVLKENGYQQQSIVSKILTKITSSRCLSQSQQQI